MEWRVGEWGLKLEPKPYKVRFGSVEHDQPIVVEKLP